MPSRLVVALILAFWCATLGLVAYRDLWPRLGASGPPPVTVDLEDEARPNYLIRWSVLRGDQKVGRLSTRMAYRDADDTFQFVHQYSQVQLDVSGARVQVPDLTSVTTITRAGDLREQSVAGRMVLQMQLRGEFHTVAEARAKVDGCVEHGLFVGRCELDSDLFKVNRALDPVPVPRGQPLNPLQPLNRIANLRPGQRWVVHEIDPLKEAVAALVQEKAGEYGFRLPEKKRGPLVAEVLPEPQSLRWHDEDVACWVIEYRGGEARARTWVRVGDGKVLRQEAGRDGERLALEREE